MKLFEDLRKQFEQTIAAEQRISALNLVVYLALAAVLALYVRFLFRKCSTTASDTDSISRVFPLLALVTTAVIAVVKSSLALSLGLVGALSIVRFRAAIKEPEELVYLFLCIAIGLSLGAEQPLLAIALVIVATALILWMYLTGRKQRQYRLLLTITGDSDKHFGPDETGVLATVESVVGRYTLERFDVDQGRGQVRIVLGESKPQNTADLIAKLRSRLPDCEMSYVNLNSHL